MIGDTFEIFTYICTSRQLSNNLIKHLAERRPLWAIVEKRKLIFKKMKTLRLLLMTIILIIVSFKGFGQKIVVTTGTDSIAGSLRDAIIKAHSGDTIVFDNSLTQIILGEKIDINKSQTIKGNPNLVIRGRGANGIFPRIFEITGNSTITVNIDNCNLFKTGFHIGDTVSYNTDGGVILIRNTNSKVNINLCYFNTEGYGGYVHYYPNIQYGQNGGAIASYGGVLNISNSTFSGLQSGGPVYTGAGGAIYKLAGELNLVNCTFYRNSVGSNFSASHPYIGKGTAIYMQNSNINVTNCTFCEHYNHFSYFRPAPDYGSVTVNTSTISLNNSKLIIKNSIFYDDDNRDLTGDANSTFISGGYNIFDQTISIADGASATDIFNVNPGFKLLGVTRYVGLDKSFWIPVCDLDAIGSAVDALPAEGNGSPQFDQRGHSRINKADIGACEFDDCLPSFVKTQWSSSKFGQDSWAYDISVANDTVVWVKDANADSISITSNAGATWKTKSMPLISGFPHSVGGVCAINKTKAYYVVCQGDSKGIYVTTDAGNSWTKQTSGFNQNSLFPDVIYFWNENEGVAIGDASPNFEIYTTANGGNQWNRVADANMPAGNNDGMYNSQNSYRTSNNSIWFLTSSARIFKSSDKGLTWKAINTPFHNAVDSVITFDFKDENNGLISYCSNDGINHKIYKTSNGGEHWDSISTSNFYQNIKYIPFAKAYFSMNKNGGLSYSCDDGQSWTNISYFDGISLNTLSYTSTGKLFLGGIKNIYSSLVSFVLSVSTNALTIAAPNNSTKTFTITSNTDWHVSSNQSWLTLSNSAGSNNTVITLTAQANPTASTRTAIVTVEGAGVTTLTITITQDVGTTGIDDITKESVSMFPNPVTNELTINELIPNSIISIFGLNGKLLINRFAKSRSEKIDVSSLAKGIYLIKVTDKKAIKTSKLIKQ